MKYLGMEIHLGEPTEYSQGAWLYPFSVTDEAGHDLFGVKTPLSAGRTKEEAAEKTIIQAKREIDVMLKSDSADSAT